MMITVMITATVMVMKDKETDEDNNYYCFTRTEMVPFPLSNKFRRIVETAYFFIN